MDNGLDQRQQVFVDPQVQGELVLKTILYWVMCITAITLMLVCWRIVTDPGRSFYMHFGDLWFHFGPVLVASTLVLPLLVYDILRMSNRFCGPLFRLRREIRALARGEHVSPISIREGDFWPELAQEFNAMLARIQRESRVLGSDPSDETAGQQVA